jgi:Ca2+-binding EF-hand superfamily protein
VRNIRAILMVGTGIPILIACGNSTDNGNGTGSAGSAAAVNGGATLSEEAAFSASLSDGDGQRLDLLTASDELDLAAAEEEVASVLDLDGGFARDCSLDAFEEDVVAEYDASGDGRLDIRELGMLRQEFRPRPIRRHRFARHHRLARLRWIYDGDDSRSLDEDEIEELRGDLEQRCQNRQAYLLENYDEDDSGSLDEEEWAQIRDDLQARKKAFRAAILDEFDADDDGRLDRDERREAHWAQHQAMKERRAAVIEEYDEDGDAELSSEEKLALREALKARVRGEHFGEDDGAG